MNAFVQIRSYLVVLLSITLLVSSCGKKPADTENDKDDAGVSSSAPDKAPAPKPAEKTAAGMIPLPTELPKPVFKGTPTNIEGVDNLRPPLGKARPIFYVPEGTTNLALNKEVASTDDLPIMGEIDMITDGDKMATDGSYVELGPFVQHITVDLGALSDVYAVLFWHSHKDQRVYFDVIVQVSDDPDFINSTTIFNNDADNSAGQGVGTDPHYVDTSEGELVDAKGVRARYVRLYSNGNHLDDLNHYTEVEIFGIPVK